MKTIKKISLHIGKVMLAILGCILMPVLIWVALGVAVHHKTLQREVGREQVPTFGEILAANDVKRE